MQHRNLTAPLITTVRFQYTDVIMKDAGMLVGDREVIDIMLRPCLTLSIKQGLLSTACRTSIG